MPDPDPIPVGVSACLVGEAVRYDGGHRLDRALVEAFAGRIEWVALCPEVGAGLGVPREALRLERTPRGVRMIGVRTGRDATAAVHAWAARTAAVVRDRGLCGFVLKSRSPSCGVRGVPLGATGTPPAPTPGAAGVFAAFLARRFPHLPRVQEDDLASPAAREHFLRRVEAVRARRRGAPADAKR